MIMVRFLAFEYEVVYLMIIMVEGMALIGALIFFVMIVELFDKSFRY